MCEVTYGACKRIKAYYRYAQLLRQAVVDGCYIGFNSVGSTVKISTRVLLTLTKMTFFEAQMRKMGAVKAPLKKVASNVHIPFGFVISCVVTLILHPREPCKEERALKMYLIAGRNP